jgi:hypothetical protein
MELGTEFWFDEEETPLPPPVWVTRVRADGSEETLRGATFAGVERWMLRDILAAGAPLDQDYLAPMSGSYGGLAPTEGMASRVRAPAVLIGEVELVPTPGDPRQLPALSPPPLASP